MVFALGKLGLLKPAVQHFANVHIKLYGEMAAADAILIACIPTQIVPVSLPVQLISPLKG